MTYTREERRTFMLFIIAAIACPFLIWSGISGLRSAAATKSWPTVEGTIRGSEVLVQQTRSRYGSTSTNYRPNMVYVYRVKGQEYFGERVSTAEPSFDDEAGARQWLSKYPGGAAVQVHYDPQDPKNAVLETGVKAKHWLLLGLGLGAAAFAVIAGRGYWRALEATTLKPRDGVF